MMGMDELVSVVGTTTVDDSAGNEGEKVLRMRKDDGESDDGKTLTVTREVCRYVTLQEFSLNFSSASWKHVHVVLVGKT